MRLPLPLVLPITLLGAAGGSTATAAASTAASSATTQPAATASSRSPAAPASASTPASTSAAAPAASSVASSPSPAAHDFDFLHGRWQIENRRLDGRLVGSTTWQTFPATGDCRPLPGGIGNLDELVTDHWPNFVGLSLRFFDPTTRQWSIYWIDNRTGVLQPPVVGGFSGDVGVFTGPDELAGRPILVRFTWTRADRNRPRWEQAFSADGGVTWETNWTMQFTRIAEVGETANTTPGTEIANVATIAEIAGIFESAPIAKIDENLAAIREVAKVAPIANVAKADNIARAAEVTEASDRTSAVGASK